MLCFVEFGVCGMSTMYNMQATEFGGSHYQHGMMFAMVPSTQLHKAASVEVSFTCSSWIYSIIRGVIRLIFSPICDIVICCMCYK